MKLQAFPFYQRSVTIEPQRMQIILPAFTLAVPAWGGASGVLAEYEIGNDDYKFSLRLPIEEFGENFVPAIRWMDGDIYVRYKLFDNELAVLNYPIYNGEAIGENAVLEIWSVDSDEAPELADDFTFETSVLLFPTTESGQCFSCCANPTSAITLTATEPSTLPPGADCNPFCGDLCSTEPDMPECECPITVVNNCDDGRDYNPDTFISPALLRTLGGLTPGDGLGKEFYWDSTSVDADTGDEQTTVIKPSSIGSGAPGRWLQVL